MYHFAEDAVKAGIKNTERKYIVTGLSYNFRKQLEFDIEKEVSLINIITWNDYPEGHHLAPEVNHNDGFAVLLKYYKSKWNNEPLPDAGKDVLVAFYKKYSHTLTPSPFNIPVTEIEKAGSPVNWEDSIEVVSILKEKGQLLVNEMKKDVPAGFQTTRFPARAGAVIISLKRNDSLAETFSCPEWITDKPYRTDRLTYSYSNQSAAFYKSVFGNYPVISSIEYNKESADNKVSFYGKPVSP
jgi:hypothetical protein